MKVTSKWYGKSYWTVPPSKTYFFQHLRAPQNYLAINLPFQLGHNLLRPSPMEKMRAQMSGFTVFPPFSLLESLPVPRVQSCQVLPQMFRLSGCPAQMEKLCQGPVKLPSCWEGQKQSPQKQAPHQSCSDSQENDQDARGTRVPGKTTLFFFKLTDCILEKQGSHFQKRSENGKGCFCLRNLGLDAMVL